MTRRLLLVAGALGLLLSVSSCKQQPTPVATPTSPSPPVASGKIVLGDISDEPVKKIGRYQPMADYLANQLGKFGIGVGEVKIAPDIETMAQMLKDGEVDLYFDSLYPAILVREQAGGDIILRRWKKGKAEYNSIFFTRSDQGLTSLADLKGKIIGFEEPFSTSGYFVPLVYLLEAGFKPIEKRQVTSSVKKNEVGYTFTSDDENTIQWVIRNKVAGGVVDSTTFSEIPPETRQMLTILAETEKVPRQVVVMAAKGEPAQQEAIKTILIEMDETETGQEILQIFEETKQFDELPHRTSVERMQESYQKWQQQ